jgi:hypothetical protein
MLSIQQINERNRSFWEEQNKLRNGRVTDPVLVAMLVAELQSPAYRLPTRRGSVEEILARADQTKHLVLRLLEPSIRQDALRERARRAGSSKRPDALQLHIVELVQANPKITAAQVLEKLQAIPRPGPVDDVDETHIHYRHGRADHLKSAPISGLKHRVSRAKKFLQSH